MDWLNKLGDISTDNLLNISIPKEKLVIGGAFYGKIYELDPNSTGFIRQRPISDPYTIVYSQIYGSYLSKLNDTSGKIKVVREWDSAANAPYLCVTEYDANGKITGKKFITYDDPESLKLKSEYVFSEGLGGIMFCELGYEHRETDTLVEEVVKPITQIENTSINTNNDIASIIDSVTPVSSILEQSTPVTETVEENIVPLTLEQNITPQTIETTPLIDPASL